MLEIVLGTQNPHKIQEVSQISTPFGVKIVLAGNEFNPDETGKTFEENSLIKAVEASRVEKFSHRYFMADDSGLVIDALNGAPGLMSARYASTNEERIEKVLKEMEGKTNRSAKFVCAMTLCNDKGDILYQTEGICVGSIAFAPSGIKGFGYDPIFVPFGFDKTMAEISQNEKNLISHRGKALRDMLIWMKLAKLTNNSK